MHGCLRESITCIAGTGRSNRLGYHFNSFTLRYEELTTNKVKRRFYIRIERNTFDVSLHVWFWHRQICIIKPQL